MLSSVFGKKSRTENLTRYTQGCLKYVNMGLQAAQLTSAALSAEGDVLKKDLERSEQELGHAKKQLEDKEGESHHFEWLPYRKGFWLQ